jgi:hypothetical protein
MNISYTRRCCCCGGLLFSPWESSENHRNKQLCNNKRGSIHPRKRKIKIVYWAGVNFFFFPSKEFGNFNFPLLLFFNDVSCYTMRKKGQFSVDYATI